MQKKDKKSFFNIMQEIKTNTIQKTNKHTDPENKIMVYTEFKNKNVTYIEPKQVSGLNSREVEPKLFIDILNELEKNEEMALFHPGIKRYKNILENLNNKEHFSEQRIDKREKNHIILENTNKIYPTKSGWKWLLNHRLFPKEDLSRIEEIKEDEKIKKEKYSNNYLFDAVQKAQRKCLENITVKDEEDKLAQKLMQDENFINFFYHFISREILASQKKDFMINITNFSITIGDKICKYLLIIKKPALYDLLFKLEEKGPDLLNDKEILWELVPYMQIIYCAEYIKNPHLRNFFKEMNIEGKKLQYTLYIFLKRKLFAVYTYMLPYMNAPKKVYYSLTHTSDYSEFLNEYKKETCRLGDIFTQKILVDNDIFSRHKELEGGPKITVKKKNPITNKIYNHKENTPIWLLKPDSKILDQIMTRYKPDIPILTRGHTKDIEYLTNEISYKLLHQDENHLIHVNDQITMKPNSHCYLAQDTSDQMEVKFSVDLDYLKEFLVLLMKTKENSHDFSIYNESLTPDDLLFLTSYIEMHNINLDIIKQIIVEQYNQVNKDQQNNVNNQSNEDLHVNNGIEDNQINQTQQNTKEKQEKSVRIYKQLLAIVKYLCNEIMQFKTFKTKAQVLQELENLEELKVEDLKKDDVTEAKKNGVKDAKKDRNKSPWKSIPHKNIIEEFVDKLCHRKLFIINLINDCIEYSLYNYFCIQHFLDSRGRAYPRLIYMNINTNHPAKLFVKLYNPNKGQAYNNYIKTKIYDILRFESSRAKLDKLTESNINDVNQKMLEEYILSLCDKNSTIDSVQELLNNPKYTNSGSMSLLRDIKPKKEKERFFIHSLIRTERIIRDSIIKPRFVNYVEKDARSSGLQMISILFCSKSLAYWANLIDGSTIDIYSTITKACKQEKDKLLFIAEQTFKSFQCENFLENRRSLVPKKLEDIPEIIRELQSNMDPSLLLHTWMNLELLCKNKKKAYKVIIPFIEELAKYYNNNNLGIFDNYSAEQLNDLKKAVPYYEKTLTYFSQNKTNIDIQTYEKLLFIQYAVRFTIIVKQRYSFLEMSSIWDSRNLFKQAIMTRFYNSTAFGRRKDFIECISEKHLLPAGYSLSSDFVEFIAFLDNFFLEYLKTIPDSDLLDQLSKYLSTKAGVTIKNTFFDITIRPKKMEIYRLLTGSKNYTIFDNIDKQVKNPQISIKIYKTTEKIQDILEDDTLDENEIDIIKNNIKENNNIEIDGNKINIMKENNTNEKDKKMTQKDKKQANEINATQKRKKYGRRRPITDPYKLVDHDKLRSTVGPNIIHSMDSSVIHYLRRTVEKINRQSPFKLGVEMNHDCYILTCPALLPILIEEAYHRLIGTEYIKYISHVPTKPESELEKQEEIAKLCSYQRMNTEEFAKLLSPINPDFIK